MTAYQITSPSRLHLGLLATAPSSPRRFGGIGLMIHRPALSLSAQVDEETRAVGPLSERVLNFADRVTRGLRDRGIVAPKLRFEIEHAPPQHSGFGTGTQLGLAVARLITTIAGQPGMPAAVLAELTGRGLRSGIGLHGFARGGLIVDGGKNPSRRLPPPLIARHPWPEDWSILVLLPRQRPGLHGEAETDAFTRLPPVSRATTDRLCAIVLLGILPALAEHDLNAFGNALTDLQDRIGEWFATVQGGAYAHADLEPIVKWLRDQGLKGVGQSSWGPALYGFSEEPVDIQEALAREIRRRFELDPDRVFWTTGDNQGAIVRSALAVRR